MPLKQDLERLSALAYRRREWSEDDIRRYHALIRKRGREAVAALNSLHRWMLVPITLWPLNFHDVFCAALDSLEAEHPLDPDMVFLLQTLPEPPTEEICGVVAEHEHLVQNGRYEELVRTATKFDSIEKLVTRNPEFQREWQTIKSHWDISRFANKKNILRRSFSSERNLRQEFKVDWSKPRQRFQAAFDAFCSRWNLYGMEGDKPLVTKLSINLTAHGTMVFIPAYWSFDAKRDVRWHAVMKLHRARSLKKQGDGLAEGLERRLTDAEKLRLLDTEAKELKLKGDARHAFLCQGLGLVEGTDPKRLSRLRKL
ncbi:MAG: hypothetical protein ACOYMS_09965 [Terrimicrobiaceae bacterium]